MWARFTEPARRAVHSAHQTALDLSMNEVDTEHLLLGLITTGDNVATIILEESLAIPRRSILREIRKQLTRGSGRGEKEAALTPQGRRAIELSYEEARQTNNNYIGAEHLLMGLAREEQGRAGQVLRSLGADIESLRQDVRAMQEGKERLVQRVKNQLLDAVERDTGLPVRALVGAATTRDPEQVVEGITQFLALSQEDQQALQSMQSPKQRLEKLSALLETAVLKLPSLKIKGPGSGD